MVQNFKKIKIVRWSIWSSMIFNAMLVNKCQSQVSRTNQYQAVGERSHLNLGFTTEHFSLFKYVPIYAYGLSLFSILPGAIQASATG